MWDWIEREAIYLWYYLDILIRQIAPYWALGIVLGSAVSVFGKKTIHGAFAKIGQRKIGWLGVIPASLLGIASPLCMYGTIPIAASFSEQGVKDDYLAAFMMSSILLNPQLLFYSSALGKTAVAIRFVSCFLCGCAAAFMITGPATKITNLGAVKIVLGWKRFILYILFAMAFAWCTGMAVDLLI